MAENNPGPIFTTVGGSGDASTTSISADDLAKGTPPSSQPKDSRETRIALETLSQKTRGYAMIVIRVLFLQIVGIALFTRGFLLSRPVFEDHSVCSESPFLGKNSNPYKSVGDSSKGCWHEKSFDKAVIVIIDALRYDFVIPDHEQDLYYHNALPYLYDMANKHPENAFLSKFMADPPTTTLQRLKGLTTGSLPTFIDAGSNFAGSEIEEDNWIAQLSALEKTIAFMGDDTWDALFSAHFHPNMSNSYDSLNVWDLHSVDNGVIKHIFPTLENKTPAKWDVAIGHLLGVDHAGHRYGPNHKEMKNKLNQMNRFIQDVVDRIDDKTLLVVMGDHGMDPKGDHGGDTQLELESTLWMYSKKPFFSKPLEDYNSRTVSQIDLVPTISLLLGLPIPFNNLGFPISEAFTGPNSKKPDYENLSRVSQLAMGQIYRYMQRFGIEPDSALSGLLDTVTGPSSLGNSEIAAKCKEFAEQVLEDFRSRWVQFDTSSIYMGLGLLVLTLSLVQAFYSKVVEYSYNQNSYTVFLVGSVLGGIGYILAEYVPGFSTLTNLDSNYTAGLFFALGIIGMSISWFSKSSLSLGENRNWNFFAIILTTIHALSFTSNSFTIWEDKILHYLLVSVGVVMFAASFRLDDIKERTIGAWHGAMFIVLSKLSSFSVLCREEQGSMCSTTFYSENSSVNSPYTIVGLMVAAFALPQIIKSFYNTTASYVGSAPLWIGWGLCICVMTVSWYWVLDGFETYSGWELPSWLDLDTLHSAKLAVARIVFGATLVAGNYGWYSGALCVKVDVRRDNNTGKKTAVVLGYSNIYGSYYFLLILNVFAAILMINKPAAGIVLCLLIYQLLTLLELIDIHGLKGSFIGPVVLGLLGSSYFFSTGHHATIPAVQWEVGFIPTSTITFPMTHLAIAMNSLGPVILTTMVAPLLISWKTEPNKTPERFQGQQVKALLGVVLYHSVIALSSMVCTFYLRRHLMLWKIFAPRFMLAGVSLGVVDIIAVIAAASSARVTTYVNSIFSNVPGFN